MQAIEDLSIRTALESFLLEDHRTVRLHPVTPHCNIIIQSSSMRNALAAILHLRLILASAMRNFSNWCVVCRLSPELCQDDSNLGRA